MSSIPNQHPDEAETDQQSVPVRLATTVLDNERAVRQFLDQLLSTAFTGDQEELRDEIRTFGSNKPLMFKAVSLTISETAMFFDDLRDANFSEEKVAVLEDLGETYSDLSNEFQVVNSEMHYGTNNPRPSIRTGLEYNEDRELPLMESTVTSEGVTLGEFRVPPSQALQMANTIVEHAGYIIRDALENNDPVDSEEAEKIHKHLARIEESLEETANHVGEVEDVTPSDDPENDEESDGENYYFN